MNTQQLLAAAMRRAILADGNTPMRSELDATGRCKTCGEPERRCSGWHAREDPRNAGGGSEG